jgi:hypothetical protein
LQNNFVCDISKIKDFVPSKSKEIFMQKIYLVMAFVVCFLGCQNSLNDNNDSKNEADLAKVKIFLPNAQNMRAVGINDTILNTDFFEAAFKNNNTSSYYFANASIGQGYIEATIPEGNYDVLLFAGDEGYYANYDPLLLASSYAQNVDITLTGPNVINMELATFDVDIIAPSKVAFGAEYSITVIIDTKNPLLVWMGGGWFGPGPSASNNPDNNINSGGFTKEGNRYTYTRTLTAPIESGSIVVEYYDYVTPFHAQAITTWVPSIPSHPIFGSNYKKTIEFVAGADVQINLNWPQ